jgi:heme exporter protein A
VSLSASPPDARHMASLTVQAIKLQRGHRVLVQDLNFAVAAGQGLMLRGANGSGKTTLLRALAGLHQPAGGSIEWRGPWVDNPDMEVHQNISYLGHLDAIKPGLSVASQLRFWADLDGIDPRRIDEALHQVGLTRQADLVGGVLSAGQRRRLALGRILIQARPIWLLDEPAAPLDREGRSLLGTLLDAHLAQGGLFVAAVHDVLPGTSSAQIWLTPQSHEAFEASL